MSTGLAAFVCCLLRVRVRGCVLLILIASLCGKLSGDVYVNGVNFNTLASGMERMKQEHAAWKDAIEGACKTGVAH